MPTSRLFAYNTGSLISGTTQVGSIAISESPSLNYSQGVGGVRWWNGPNEDLGYVITHTTPSGTQPNPDNVPAYIGFWRSPLKTENSLITFTNNLFGTSHTTGDQCKTWLNANGYWTSFGEIVTDNLLINLDAGNTQSYPGSGTVWNDISGFQNNGTLINGPTFNSSNGGSIVFDGVDDYVQCAGSFPLTSATIITWIRRNGSQTSFAGIFFTRGGQSITGLNFYYNTNKIGYHWAAGYWDFDSNLTIPDLTWCMVALSVTSTAGILYLCQSSGITTATNTNSHPSIVLDNIKLAQDDTFPTFGIYRFFKGNIAISQLYNRALSSNEITQNFNAQKGRFGL